MSQVKKAFQPLFEMLEANKGKKIDDKLINSLKSIDGIMPKAGGASGGAGHVETVVDGVRKVLAIYDTFQQGWYPVNGATPQAVTCGEKSGTRSGLNIHTGPGSTLYSKSRKLANDLTKALGDLDEMFESSNEMTKQEWQAKKEELRNAEAKAQKVLREEIVPGFDSEDAVKAHLKEHGHAV